MSPSYSQCVASKAQNGPNVSNTSSPTSLLYGTGSTLVGSPMNSQQFNDVRMGIGRLAVPAALFQPGRVFRLTAVGRISCMNPSPGNITLSLVDYLVSLNQFAVCGPIALNTAAAKTNVAWWLEWMLTCRSNDVVNGITFMHAARFQSEAVIGSPLPAAGGSGSIILPSPPVVGQLLDPTDPCNIDLQVTFSVANSANNMMLFQSALEVLN